MPELTEIKDELQKGITFHRKGQLHQAELRYQKTLQIHPQNAEAYYFMSIIAHQIGKYNVAIELIKKAKSIGTNPPHMADMALNGLLNLQMNKVFGK